MQVLVLPSHGDLQHLMEKDQGDRVFHAQASPDRWLDPMFPGDGSNRGALWAARERLKESMCRYWNERPEAMPMPRENRRNHPSGS
jgi:hypothetical protein